MKCHDRAQPHTDNNFLWNRTARVTAIRFGSRLWHGARIRQVGIHPSSRFFA
ncbi:hypothetical protein [Komagataeibacter europaeus]|uniref:hypothetical protein n=1 Tax=Komagataeibacter europaeus TaxID=33995 RepID=UPI000237F2CF|nr:hypothetical protein [Komagataeibacter europaeus]